MTCATLGLVMNDSQRFAQAELILAGHGSTQNLDSARPVYQHAAELRRRGVFARVHEAFWNRLHFCAMFGVRSKDLKSSWSRS
jgi:hypothetical protein